MYFFLRLNKKKNTKRVFSLYTYKPKLQVYYTYIVTNLVMRKN